MNNPNGSAENPAEDSQTLFRWVASKLAEPLGLSAESSPTVFQCALAHGHHEFIKLFSGAGADEEHRTSTLMGLVSAHIGWYQFIAELSGETDPVLCRWSVADKSTEAKEGMDFGVALDVGEKKVKGENVRFFQLAYFQAKMADLQESGEKITINQIPGGYGDDKFLRYQADSIFKNWCGSEEPVAIDAPAGTGFDEVESTKQHQIIKLAISDLGLRKKNDARDMKISAMDASCVHYVSWRTGGNDALVIPLEAIRQQLKGRMLKVDSTGAALETSDSGILKSQIDIAAVKTTPFHQFLATGETENAVGWARLSEGDAIDIIESWPVLGARWLLVGSGTSGLMGLNRAHGNIQPISPSGIVPIHVPVEKKGHDPVP